MDRHLFTALNSPAEVGLRAICVLAAAFPSAYSVRRLTVLDYLLVHSDDLPNGPAGLHPKTPFRSGEVLVRREVLQRGLRLYESRGLISREYRSDGIRFMATDDSGWFIDGLRSTYVGDLRSRARWLEASFSEMPDADLADLVAKHLGEWGAEFEFEAVLSEVMSA